MKNPMILSVLSLGTATVALGGLLNTISCPDCGNTVSVRAVYCPKCGCAKGAIRQHYEAVERASRMSDAEARSLLGPAYMGQVGRLQFLRDKSAAECVLTNQVIALRWYSEAARKRALNAREKVVRMQELGFTLDQIFTMRMDLIADLLGRTK